MMETANFEPGGYRYVRGPFQYSGGVAALPGFTIERVRFAKPVPVEAGFRIIEDHLKSIDRPFTSFCACELRSPAPFTDEGFIAFNRIYVGTLERWGIFKDDENPVARSNVCPEVNPPAEPSFEAFSYTVPAAENVAPSFVIAGSAESMDRPGKYADRIVRYDETSPDAIREKACYVLDVMAQRMAALGVDWSKVSASQVYTIHDLHPFLADEIVRRGAAEAGLTWYYARPPVIGLEYEMDVRGTATERVI
jgi:hypothetical protein